MTPEEIYEGFQDHERFCRESLQVQDKQGKMVPMHLGPAQKRLNEIVSRCRARKKPVRIISLKARQVWVSVGTAAHFFHRTPFLAGQHAMVLANDEATSLNLFQHYQRFADNYQPFGGLIKLPKVTQNSTASIEWDNGAWIKAATTRTLTIGRSFTLRRVHFSEAAFYADLKTLMAAVMAAMPDDPDTMAVVESTANGVGNEFHRLWLQAASGESEWEPFFFAWWEHPEYVRPLEDPGRFQATLSQAEREMMRRYNLRLDQLHWRRWIIANKLGGDATLFAQEYPANAEEAFLTSGRPRFDHAVLNRMPLIHDPIAGGLETQVYGGSQRIAFIPREKGELRLFRKPDPAKTYVIGADSAEGIDANEGKGEPDPDYAVAIVRERETGDQAATLRARMEPAEFGRYLALLGRYFNMAAVVPEINNTGIAAVDALLGASYPPGLVYHRLRAGDDDPKERADKIGWRTTAVTRPQLISWYDAALREMSIYIRDPTLLQEARTFVIKANGRAEHAIGCHDDCVFADALSVVGIAQMPKARPAADVARPALGKYGERPADSRGQLVRLR